MLNGSDGSITEVGIGRCVAVVSELFKQAFEKQLLYRRLADTRVAMCVGIARARNGDLPPAAEKLCATIRKIGKAD